MFLRLSITPMIFPVLIWITNTFFIEKKVGRRRTIPFFIIPVTCVVVFGCEENKTN